MRRTQITGGRFFHTVTFVAVLAGLIAAVVSVSLSQQSTAAIPATLVCQGQPTFYRYTYASDAAGQYATPGEAASADARARLTTFDGMRDEGFDPRTEGLDRRIQVAVKDGQDIAVFVVARFSRGFNVLGAQTCAEHFRSS